MPRTLTLAVVLALASGCATTPDLAPDREALKRDPAALARGIALTGALAGAGGAAAATAGVAAAVDSRHAEVWGGVAVLAGAAGLAGLVFCIADVQLAEIPRESAGIPNAPTP
jgi:hypothetical protein